MSGSNSNESLFWFTKKYVSATNIENGANIYSNQHPTGLNAAWNSPFASVTEISNKIPPNVKQKNKNYIFKVPHAPINIANEVEYTPTNKTNTSISPESIIDI